MESIQTSTFGDFSAYYMISLKLNIYKYLMLLLFPFRRECVETFSAPIFSKCPEIWRNDWRLFLWTIQANYSEVMNMIIIYFTHIHCFYWMYCYKRKYNKKYENCRGVLITLKKVPTKHY